MSPKAKALSEAALSLPPDELSDLIDELLAALHASDPTWNEAWAAEAAQRMEAYRRGETETYSLEEVLAPYRDRKCRS